MDQLGRTVRQMTYFLSSRAMWKVSCFCPANHQIEWYQRKGGVWEELHNPDFNRVQCEAVKNEAGLNRFVMTSTKWITQMNAIANLRYGAV